MKNTILEQYYIYTLLLEHYITDLEFEMVINKTIQRIMDKEEPPLPINPWKRNGDIPPNPYTHCHKCGIKLDTVMGYCCPNLQCPTGLGPIICQNTN